jgi:tetratricopeptide (TPR) repeat protein
MGFLSSLFGGTFEGNRADGDGFFADRDWGEARMAYERALRKGAGVQDAEIAAVRERMARCRLELARGRIVTADALAEAGELEDARAMLEDAIQICDAAEIALAAGERRSRYEAEAARQLAEAEGEMTEEELLAVLAGTWVDSQADEYAAMPDRFREALLLDHDQEHEQAAGVFAEVIGDGSLEVEPRFAYFELGKALVGAQRFEEAEDALESFVSKVEGDDTARDLLLAALTMLGRVLLSLERPEEADAALVRATRMCPENHVAYLNLGVFLRNRGELERSIEALEKAVELMGQLHPDFRVIREIGFTYLAMGRMKDAERNLYAVIEHQASQGNHDQFDPEAAVPLARLYETNGDLEKAADLYRHLAVGYDTRNHFLYNLEAARLLGKMSGPARELARTDDHLALLAALGTPTEP